MSDCFQCAPSASLSVLSTASRKLSFVLLLDIQTENCIEISMQRCSRAEPGSAFCQVTTCVLIEPSESTPLLHHLTDLNQMNLMAAD